MKIIFRVVTAVAVTIAVVEASPFLAVFAVICLAGVSKNLGGVSP